MLGEDENNLPNDSGDDLEVDVKVSKARQKSSKVVRDSAKEKRQKAGDLSSITPVASIYLHETKAFGASKRSLQEIKIVKVKRLMAQTNVQSQILPKRKTTKVAQSKLDIEDGNVVLDAQPPIVRAHPTPSKVPKEHKPILTSTSQRSIMKEEKNHSGGKQVAAIKSIRDLYHLTSNNSSSKKEPPRSGQKAEIKVQHIDLHNSSRMSASASADSLIVDRVYQAKVQRKLSNSRSIEVISVNSSKNEIENQNNVYNPVKKTAAKKPHHMPN